MICKACKQGYHNECIGTSCECDARLIAIKLAGGPTSKKYESKRITHDTNWHPKESKYDRSLEEKLDDAFTVDYDSVDGDFEE